MLHSIKTQLLMGQMTLVALLTLALGGGMFHLAVDILERKELEKVRLLAAGLARETALAVNEGETHLRLMASSSSLDRFEHAHDYHVLQALFDRYRGLFTSLAYVNAQGVREYAATGAGYTDSAKAAPDDSLVTQALAAPGTVVSALRPTGDGRPAWLLLALTREDSFGRPLGVFLGALPVAAIARSVTELRLEHGGYAVLVDGHGMVLSVASPDGRQIQVAEASHGAEPLADGSDAGGQDLFNGEPNLIGAAPLGLHGLSILVVLPRQRVIDAEMNRLRLLAMVVAAIAAFTAVLGALWWTRGITGPLARLAATARAVSGGDLSARAPTTGPSETRELGAAFNAMTEGLAASHQGLTRAKESLERIFSNVNEALWVVDGDGRVSLCNRAGCAMLGYDEHEILGTPAARLFAPDDPLATFLESAPIQNLLAAGGLTGLEKTLYGKGGRTVPVLVSLALLRGPGEDDAGVVCLAMDVTERKRAEDLTRARKAAEAVSRAKTEFLAVLSHELRTPLNIMLGMLEHVQALPLPPKSMAGVGQALKSGQTMLEVIAAMLDYASLEAERVILRRQPFAPGILALDVASRFADTAQAKNVAVTVDLSPLLPAALVGDPTRLCQVLTNLLGNAVRFTMGGEASLYLGGQAVGTTWQFLAIIVDTGMGVTDAKLEYIFEPFTQEDGSSTRRFGGLGLGLAITRRLVALMGGTICMDSRPGQGTAVYVSLPLEMDVASEHVRRPAPVS
ncbi:ATP-binding protein [Desulfovibrio sp. TomC]|uniref:ATP-binding protein n=1 Tax=Desulfovibrio sp. TomC TaxID=1562888 RepID=UPI000574F5B0|nr:ATP-binding protein [Desulfovibrio sp. TomC]KHK03790.1 diguanylate cyclase/phosphodiesterase (GGDEF & EAL domains) with PAS/PAC sensor(s) [Desulfovibrio sp. TomC]